MKHLPALFLLAVFTAACTSTDEQGNQTVHFHPGGEIGAMLAELNANYYAQTYVRIEGTCASACTMHIHNMKNGLVCVDRDAKMMFHGSTHPLGFFDGNDAPGKDRADSLVAQTYPENLRRWYWDEGRFDGTITTFTGAELYAMDPDYIVLCD